MPGIGTGSSRFAVSVGWHYAKASRSYFNSRLNHNFTDLWKPVERLSILDVSAAYKINKRFAVIASLPIVTNQFSIILPPQSPSHGQRYSWNANGIGDLSIYTQGTVLNPKDHLFENVYIGAGIKIPTGNWDVMAKIPDETGKNASKRAVYPPSVQPGDGGVGILVGISAFKIPRWRALHNSITVSASANYLINPANTNGTRSIISNLGVPLSPEFYNRLTNSVTDSYILSSAIAWRPPFFWDKPLVKQLRFLALGKLEGVPRHDLIGKSEGFRQPGYTLAVGPGVSWSHGKDMFIAEVPIVFNRYIDPGATELPGLPVHGGPGPFNPNRQLGTVAPLSLSIRYVRSF